MWQTLNTRSVMAYVGPSASLQVAMGLFEHAECKHLRECLIGRPPQGGIVSKANDLPGVEDVHSRPRLIDAVYTELSVRWRGIGFTVTTADDGGDLVALVEPELETLPHVAPLLTVEGSLRWNAAGSVGRETDRLFLRDAEGNEQSVYATRPWSDQAVTDLGGAHGTLVLDGPVGVCTGGRRTLDGIREKLAAGKARRDAELRRFGDDEGAELAGAVHSALGWTAIHDPSSGQTVTTVSRVWAGRNNGSVIFCWDSFFAAMMAAALGHADLAASNLDAITRPIDGLGYVPNVLNAVGSATFGHSQPPVGSMAVRYAAEALGRPDLAGAYLDRLLAWNRWWPRHRDRDGNLCWGSKREPIRIGGGYETSVTGGLQGTRFESGLDNSPMYDDAEYDEKSGLMLLADVGLMSLYIRDCLDLARLCCDAGREGNAAELEARASAYADRLDTLWDDRRGLYLNRDLASGEPSPRLSPTLFYPLLTGRVPADRAERIVREHLLNPGEFRGEHVLPSISRDDPAYGD